MNDFPRLGYLHSSDGVSIVGPDGFCHEIEDVADLIDDTPAALEVPTIDVAPESVTDREIGQRGIEN